MDDYSKIFIALTLSFTFIGLAFISKIAQSILKKKENTAPLKQNQEIDNSISKNQNYSVDEIGISPYEKFETMQNDSELVQKNWWQQFEDSINKFQDYWDVKIWDFWTNHSGIPEFLVEHPKICQFLGQPEIAVFCSSVSFSFLFYAFVKYAVKGFVFLYRLFR